MTAMEVILFTAMVGAVCLFAGYCGGRYEGFLRGMASMMNLMGVTDDEEEGVRAGNDGHGD